MARGHCFPLLFSCVLPRSGISGKRRSRLEIADPDNDSAHTHEVSALVSTAHVAGWPLNMNEAAFGNGACDIGRFGSLAEFVEPIRNVVLGDIGRIVTVRHGATSPIRKTKLYHG